MKLTKERIDEVKALRAQKMTFREIGLKLGVTRQRAFQILNGSPFFPSQTCSAKRIRDWRLDLARKSASGL